MEKFHFFMRFNNRNKQIRNEIFIDFSHRKLDPLISSHLVVIVHGLFGQEL